MKSFFERKFCGMGGACWAALAVCLGLSGCEPPPNVSVQRGYRGTGIALVANPSTLDAQAALNKVPEMAAPARLRVGGPTAGTTYQNVLVLNDLSLAEFGRTMDAITAWVSPKESCAYCHVVGNFADDSKYTKVVARRMMQMVRHLNQDWKSHVGTTGVTCYTCHRGNPLPQQVWFRPLPPTPHGLLRDGNSQSASASQLALQGSLPAEVLVRFLSADTPEAAIRIAGHSALPGGVTASTNGITNGITNGSTNGSANDRAPGSSIEKTESTYALMMHISQSLGVNCTFCHNSRSFSDWGESSPQRVTAWYGLRMVRDVNSNYLSPLSGVFPEIPLGRLGPTKDAAKVHCGTCHQGAYKPLYGAAMARHYPGLQGDADRAALVTQALAAAAKPAQ